MRMNRLVLALTPLCFIACGNSGTSGGSVESGGTAAGGRGSATGGGVAQPTGGKSSGGSGETSSSTGSPTGGASVNSSTGIPAGGASVNSSTGIPAGGASVGGSTSSRSGTFGGMSSSGTVSAGGSAGSMGGLRTGGSGGRSPVGGSGGMVMGGATSGGRSAGGTGNNGGVAGASGSGTPSDATCPFTAPIDPASFPQDWTSSKVTVFNNNGGWTWYNDERVVVDAANGKIILSSAESSASSQSASPNIDVVIHDLATGANEKTKLGSLSYSDDHNNGGILMLGPGKYFVGWAHHNKECTTHWRNYDNGAWGAEQTFDWSSKGCPWGTSGSQSYVTYNNPWKINGKYYDFIRSVDTSPNFLVSDDGKTWTFGGRLTSTPKAGYNAGYYKYWGNNVDRVDFFATEAHPRDADTSLYHGYIEGTKIYDSTGTEKDGNLLDTNAVEIKSYTTVFASGGKINGLTLHNLWNFDIARYEDGTIGVLWQGRENQCADKNNCDPKHHVLYSRFANTKWTSTYLVKGGRTLYRDRKDWWEEDYLGGAALDPDDPHVIYVSTNIDPRDNKTEYTVNEIWKGVSCDDGASFTWTPMTMKSQHENLRPVVPKWDANNTALVWFRGDYQTAQMFSAEVVGIVTRK